MKYVNKLSPTTWFIVVVVIVFVLFYFSVNNSAATKDENVNGEWSNVGVTVQRRLDLYPALEAAIVGMDTSQLAVFEALAEQAGNLAGAFKYDAGHNALPPQNEEEARLVEERLNSFNNALVVAMNYAADNPDIVNVVLYEDFMMQAEGTENRIAVARKRYNEAVEDARTFCRKMPASFFCNMSGYDVNDWVYFNASEEAQKPPELDFGVND
ncbi:hypothetical protein A2382_03210 [Candidatus Woesebacteria bacterium RIFOXYB1_FULL_38_16]|uniref:LemA family protein n=1 Tax=Candidatus Woesebacteria bacterium RIFOXYB1_FULL_38_16 TaxID=1802538 RepID=A0A1F8CUC1_9BACT|nr:MAG: hypothetical protein A2191_02785 [Candidatus Woesebacteria bacterium RIFOXYA1_FULL_38_9]OGM79910.1 MAG: hypothetical protein A2382_03210 [Candidatus Woesebacteria bacterium RIFOXYB1_FULL_38_16]